MRTASVKGFTLATQTSESATVKDYLIGWRFSWAVLSHHQIPVWTASDIFLYAVLHNHNMILQRNKSRLMIVVWCALEFRADQKLCGFDSGAPPSKRRSSLWKQDLFVLLELIWRDKYNCKPGEPFHVSWIRIRQNLMWEIREERMSLTLAAQVISQPQDVNTKRNRLCFYSHTIFSPHPNLQPGLDSCVACINTQTQSAVW